MEKQERFDYKGFTCVRNVAEDDSCVDYTICDSDGEFVDHDSSQDPEEFSVDYIKSIIDNMN
jgi:hypothetical protein